MKAGEPNPNILDHVIQKDIVKTLVSKGAARFSELKPARTESNLFMYHLKQLIKGGIVEKQGTTYQLTTEGRMFVDRANLDRLEFRVQPKIITVLAVQSSSGSWLMLERLHEPHMHRIGFPSGKLHYGETLDQAAIRELQEKTGLTDVPLKLGGSMVMRFLDKTGQSTINHTIAYIYTGSVAEETALQNVSTHWRAFWGSKDQLLNGNVFKGHADTLQFLATGKMFIESLDYESDY